MDINWTELLDAIQDLRAQLEAWGVTYEILICLGIAALALFLISLREIVVWYLRLSQLQAQMQQMSKQLTKIQSSVEQVQVQTLPKTPVFQDSPAETPEGEEEEGEPEKAARKKFALDH